MKAFRVTVRTSTSSTTFYALGKTSASVHAAAEKRFDQPCGITVIHVSKERACH
ncbi:hypothetical protein [Herbaspirillum sp. ST 5-3]|uniref:hypothetical protein n=1 Tax=Oxalobacteraceae TaxID=75682 RepID=UPI00145611E1|nr:hypothetical protein [Herbaspirillum sp. ST 5-3]